MALIVQKYGGTSMGTPERIIQVAKRVKTWADAGHQVVVVVSAISGETNRLTALAKAVSNAPSRRELDVILSSGEQVTIGLLSLALQNIGQSATSFTGWQAGVTTDAAYSKARIATIKPDRIRAALNSKRVAVVAGFQGIDEEGNLTTLGRGGSDTSGVALAAALNADECQIYTDVDGVFSTDPRVEAKAKAMKTLTFEEMLEMASLGAKVLQIRSVEFAFKYNVPLRVLSSFSDTIDLDNLGGTLICADMNNETEDMEKPLISGIAFNRDEAKITILSVPDTPGIAFEILGSVSDANIEVDMIIQNVAPSGCTDFTFTVSRNDYQEALRLSKAKAESLGAGEVISRDDIAKLSLVGVGMRSHSGVASSMFKTLSEHDINIQLISTSEIKISVIIDEAVLDTAVKALHEAFNLDQA